MSAKDGPENTKQIQAFMHCGLCLRSVPPNLSAAEYAELEVGWTARGFQVWCRRHDVNVCHVDFEGTKHRANTTRRPKIGLVE